MKNFVSYFTTLTIVTILTVLTVLPIQAATFSDFTLGNTEAPVKMEVFNDFQCPYCARFHKTLLSGTIQRLVRSGQLSITFKDFPLEFHSNAKSAARAVNAVLSIEPKKYRTYMNFIFRTQTQWGNMEEAMNFFADKAEQIGIGRENFRSAFNDRGNLREIAGDIGDGISQKVMGTPSYTINGELQAGAQSLKTLLEQILSAQKKAKPLKPEPEPESEAEPAPQPDQSISNNTISSGTSVVNIMEGRVSAELQDFTIDTMTIRFKTDPGFGFSTVSSINIIAYGKIFRSFPAAAVTTMNGLKIPAPKNAQTSFFIQLVLGDVGITGGSSGEKVSVSIDNVRAINSNGGLVLMGGFPLNSNTITVYASTMVLTPNALPTTRLTSASDQTIADFTAKKRGEGRAGWISLRLSINKSSRAGGIGAIGCSIRKISDGSSVIPGICTVTSTDPSHPSSNTIPDLATTGTLTFTASNEQVLRTEGERYQIHLETNGSASSGENLSAMLSQSPAGTTSTPGTNAAAAIATGASFIWTDGSAAGHSQSTNDWYNDFGFQQLPLVYSLSN